MCGPNQTSWCSYCNTAETHHSPSCPLVVRKEEEDKQKHLDDVAILNQHARKSEKSR